MGARRISCCSGVKETLPRPWYERVQSIAGTPSSSGGESERPSVRDRWARASFARVSSEALRVVGTGASFAGYWGTTVRMGVAVLVVDEVAAAGFAVVDVLAVAARAVWDEKVRWDVCRARDEDREDDDESRAEKPLRTGRAAIVWDVGSGVQLIVFDESGTLPTRSHDLIVHGLPSPLANQGQ